MLKKRWSLLAFSAVLLPGTPVFADTVTLISSRDNTLYFSPSGSISNGSGDSIFAGNTRTNSVRRALLFFNLAGVVPTNATIQSVELTLTVTQTIADQEPMFLHRVLANWGESTSIGLGSGGAAQPGDATWLHRFYDNQFWSREGGDFSSTVSSSQMVGGLGAYTWASTPQLIADVQQWVNAPDTNFGWLLKGEEAHAISTKRFGSRESTIVSDRPSLRITFTTSAIAAPEPATGLLVGLVVLAGVLPVRTRKRTR